MRFTIDQSKDDVINPALLLVFIDSVHFLKESLDNLVKNLVEKDIYLLSQHFDADVLALVKKKRFFFL